jgi:hypothetical protein
MVEKTSYHCRSRVFASGLDTGRTCGGAWKTFTNKDVAEARQQVEDQTQ